MIKAFKVQLQPNNKQRSLLFQCAGTARWAYNHALARQKQHFEETNGFISHRDIRKELTQLKRTDEFKWLYQYSNNITKQAIKDADTAFRNFFRKNARYPRFKSKRHTRPSFYHDPVKLKLTERHVQLEMTGKIRLREPGHIPLGVKYVNPRISFDGINWWISVGVDVGDLTLDMPESAPVGVDLGVSSLAVVSDGRRFKNINKTRTIRQLEKKLRRLQRKASRHYIKLQKGGSRSKRLNRLEREVRRTHLRLTNLRDNHLHQITSTLVKAKPEFIVIEDLNVSGMMKNRCLSEKIAKQKWHEFRRQLEYKCEWYGVALLAAPRFLPSSKTCSSCGAIKNDLRLSDRTFTCEDCGTVIDRDLNASINLIDYGRSIA